MDMERVYATYYVFTSITLVLVILGLGKFFCVGRIYDLYDDIDERIDHTLGPISVLATLVLILSLVALALKSEFFILVACVVMAFLTLICTAALLIYFFANIGGWLSNYHERLRNRKNM